MKKYFSFLLSLLLIIALLPFQGLAKEKDDPDVELWNVVNPLHTTATFLNTGAHPDDERSDLLAYLSRGLGVKTASLIANRGEGGQNEIGNELGTALGIIRSNEMIEAAKITGVKAYHLSETTSDPIYDFGFSKSPEETLEKWGEELTYERLIRFIRSYQPDVVMPAFRNVPSQHGHHRTMAILSQRAFEDAADPNVFPEQIEDEGLSPWQVKKFYLPAESEDTSTTSVEIGDYDPIYEMSYPQLGQKSRYMHKSQGMGIDVPVEPKQFHLELVKSIYPQNKEDDGIFDNIPYDFNDWATVISDNSIRSGLENLQQELDEIIDLYPDREAILPNSQDALKNVRKLIDKVEKRDTDPSAMNDLLHKLKLKEEQLQEVSLVASGLDVNTTLDSEEVTRGESTKVEMTITNNGKKAIHHIDTTLLTPKGWTVDNSKSNIKKLEPNESKDVTFTVDVPEDATYYQPYGESSVKSSITFKEKGAKTTNIQELDETFAVLPKIAIATDPGDIVLNTADVKNEYNVNIKVKNYAKGEKSGSVKLDLPEGWTSTPEKVDMNLKNRLDEQIAEFKITPPKNIEEGDFSIGAIAESDNEKYDTSVQEISYDHINDAYFQYPATVNVSAFELLKPDSLKIGYIDSGFDEVADYLLDVGFDVTKLSETDLQSGDLSQYDTIVTGIRANLSRPDLIENNKRLLEYAKNGGHVVAQYHKPGDNWDTNETPPYPLEIGNPSIEWRVTDEDSDVTMTQPDHKLFNYPNKITENDWDGWVQERGLYFPMNWDDRYETFVSMADPGEDPFDGGILMADYGDGTYLYTSLVFYRQIANQIPGGYRIFTNLLSYGVEKDAKEISASEIKTLIERLANEGEFDDENDVRLLTTHLTAVSHYENKEQGEKVVKHMTSFKQLIHQLLENDSISEKTYNELNKDADSLIKKWQ